MNAKEILIAARDLIADRTKWTRGSNAKDANGNAVGVASPEACSWCAYGALAKFLLHGKGRAARKAKRLVAEAGGGRDLVELTEINDKPVKSGGGRKKVIEVFDRAIELA